MKIKLNKSKTLLGILCIMALVHACEKEASDTDKELFDMAKTTAGFTWYKKSDVLLNKSIATGHAEALLRTRFNSVAAAKLDAQGNVIDGTSFPEGSLIVKELYSNATTLSKYAILYKKSDHADADAKGWVWGYLNTDGSVVSAASKKGNGCNGCHGQAGNIDYVLMKKFFP